MEWFLNSKRQRQISLTFNMLWMRQRGFACTLLTTFKIKLSVYTLEILSFHLAGQMPIHLSMSSPGRGGGGRGGIPIFCSGAHTPMNRTPYLRTFWLSIHPINFGSHVTVLLSTRPHHRATNIECHTFQPVWNLILHIHVVVSDSCPNRVYSDQYHVIILKAQVSTIQVNFF